MPRSLLLLFVALTAAAASVRADDPAPRAHVFEAKLNPSAWAAMFTTLSPDGSVGVRQQIPIVRCYDTAGNHVGERIGYVPGISSWVSRVARWPGTEDGKQLRDLLSSLTTADGRPFEAGRLPQDEVVVVEFGAEWCAPCRSIKAELEAIPGLTLLAIDVDKRHMPWDDVLAAVRQMPQ